MKKITVVLVLFSVLLSCSNYQSISVIPYPNSVSFKSGTFAVTNPIVTCISVLDSLTLTNVKHFSDQIGADFTISDKFPSEGFHFCCNPKLADEAYTIDVTRKIVRVEASGLRGYSYAIQTLLQMLPLIPCCYIEDAPRFAYRGLHLDEARHFFGMDEVKKYIDIMSFHKLNKLHWHLTDDQGWRVEIKKYPELTSVGSVRNGTCIRRNYNTNDGIPYGEGFWYTQDQIREIVAYAASKGIDIIPEIDIPGHMLAALTAYPHLGCTGGPYKVWHRWGVSNDVLCIGNEKSYEFLTDIFSEICELFPYEYIHIGGDECPKDSWKICKKCQAKISELGLKDDMHHKAEHYLQSYVMNRIESFLNTLGKKVIGWDEILEGAPSQSATVMSWRGEQGGIEAAAKGHDVIMTPNTYCYWDYYQATDIENEPFAIGGYVPVDLVYSYEPYTDEMNVEARSKILGVQANIWTEYISTADHLEYMLLPRLAALSEVQWCNIDNKNWDRFLDSMDEVSSIYDKMGYRWAEHVFGVRCHLEPDPESRSATVSLYTQGDALIYYTLDGTDPDDCSILYEGPFEISETCVLKASAQRDGKMTRPISQKFSFHKAVGRNLTLTHKSQAMFSAETGESLVDGIRGPAIHKSKEWCCWTAKHFEAVIDMKACEPYSSVEVGYFVNKPSQIFNPLSLVVSVSDNGVDYEDIAAIECPAECESDPDGLKNISVMFPETSARYLKVKAECMEYVPSWHHYNGRNASLYIDEVIVD